MTASSTRAAPDLEATAARADDRDKVITLVRNPLAAEFLEAGDDFVADALPDGGESVDLSPLADRWIFVVAAEGRDERWQKKLFETLVPVARAVMVVWVPGGVRAYFKAGHTPDDFRRLRRAAREKWGRDEDEDEADSADEEEGPDEPDPPATAERPPVEAPSRPTSRSHSVLRTRADFDAALEEGFAEVEKGNPIAAARALERALARFEPEAPTTGDAARLAAERAVAPWFGDQAAARAVVWTLFDRVKRKARGAAPVVETGWPEHPEVPGLPDPEPLPAQALPSFLRAYVRTVAGNLQVPLALPLVLVLAVLSATLAGKIEVAVRSGWREVVGLFLAIILPPASRKSPTFAEVTAPVREEEAEAVRKAAPHLLAAQDAVDVASKKLDRTKSRAEKGQATMEAVEAARLELQEVRAKMPSDGRLLAGDITPEAMVQRMAHQDGRLALMEPEPGPLQQLAGRYSDSARLDEIKKAWSGEALRVDRVTREPVAVPRPALTIAVCVQPDVIENLQNADAFRIEGVHGRFVWAWPPHGLGERRTGPDVPPLDSGARAEYRRVVRELFKMDAAGTDETTGALKPHVLTLAPEAADVLHSFEAEVETELADDGRFAAIRDWAGKAVGQAVRIAALLEVAGRAAAGRDLPGERIGPEAMESAVQLVRALASHALVVLGKVDPHTELLRTVWRRARKLPEKATLRDLWHRTKSLPGVDTMADLEPLVEELASRGCLRLREQESTGGRPPSPVVEIHPNHSHSEDTGHDADLAEELADV